MMILIKMMTMKRFKLKSWIQLKPESTKQFRKTKHQQQNPSQKNLNLHQSMPPPTNVKRVKANVTRNGPQNTRIKLTELFDQLVVNKKWTETSRNWPKRCMSISKVKSYSTKRKTKRVTFCRFLITLQISLQPKWSQRSFTKSNKAAHSKNVD